MTEKEIAEIRRRFKPEKTNIKCIRGCYVSESKEIISEFNQFYGTMPKEEAAEILNVIKKTISGTIGKNLIDIEFSNEQVVSSDEHELLMKLKNSELEDDEAVSELYRKIISTHRTEDKYLILLSFDSYDVPSYTKDDVKLEDSADVYKYVLCSICPVKMTKPALSYSAGENQFRHTKADWIISNPELGFLFPTFDYRQSNIYNVLCYTKDPADSHDEVIAGLFNTDVPMAAETQKEVFNSILEESVSEKCSYDVMQTVHEQISAMVLEHKASKEDEPLALSKRNMTDVLEYCGVDEEHIAVFADKYDSEFGEDAKISPKNIVDIKKFELKTPDITIKVNPERKDLVKTEVINGVKYIMIRADDNVEVNGVSINIANEENADSTEESAPM